MRLSIVALLLAAAPIAHAQDRLLTVREILHVLEGRWVMAHDVDADGNPLFDCTSDEVLNITLIPGERTITYRGWHDDAPELVSTSIVKASSRNDDPNQPGAVVLEYDGEDRLDDAGNPVVWHLLMTDRDTFYWHREDWESGDTTPPSRRCPADAAIG